MAMHGALPYISLMLQFGDALHLHIQLVIHLLEVFHDHIQYVTCLERSTEALEPSETWLSDGPTPALYAARPTNTLWSSPPSSACSAWSCHWSRSPFPSSQHGAGRESDDRRFSISHMCTCAQRQNCRRRGVESQPLVCPPLMPRLTPSGGCYWGWSTRPGWVPYSQFGVTEV